eukprot:3876842-Amphidinium_carterae.1
MSLGKKGADDRARSCNRFKRWAHADALVDGLVQIDCQDSIKTGKTQQRGHARTVSFEAMNGS